MSNIQLNSIQARVKSLAENVVLKDKMERMVILQEMTKLNQQLTTEEQLQLVMAIETLPAIRFLAASGIRGDARIALFARTAVLEKQLKQ